MKLKAYGCLLLALAFIIGCTAQGASNHGRLVLEAVQSAPASGPAPAETHPGTHQPFKLKK